MDGFITVDRRSFFMPPKKGQVFTRYSEEIKKEAVPLRVEEQWSYATIRKKLGIKSDAQIIAWVQKYQNGESFVDYRDAGIRSTSAA